jgi:hypothetical protein
MLILVPIGLLLVGSLAGSVVFRIRPKYGTSWLIAAAASTLAWLTLFYLRLRLPTTLGVLSWERPSGALWGDFSLVLDYDSWPYTFALATITLAVILTDAARTRFDSTPKSWSASLAITALGLISIQSGTDVTLMITWVLVDLLELVYLLGTEETIGFNRQIILSFAIRIASILTLTLAAARNWQVAGTSELTEIAPEVGFLFLLAAGFRLGVLPLNLPFLNEPSLRRGVGNIIRLAPVTASLSLLARLPEGLVTSNLAGWMPLFHGLLSIAALYAAFHWLVAADVIEGRSYWIITWAALGTASVLNGAPGASLAWGSALILPGSLLFLYYPRIQRMNFLLYFGLIGLIGLPFTPIASGWTGLVANGVNLWTFLYVIAHALMILGYLKFALEPGGENRLLESWARLVYPLGLIIIVQTILALGLIGWPGSLTLGVWWLPLISTILILSAFYFIQRAGFDTANIKLPSSSTVSNILNWTIPRIEPIFRLEWIYQLVWRIFGLFSKFLKAFTTILEGEGGVLWTILLLVLLISLLISTGGN